MTTKPDCLFCRIAAGEIGVARVLVEPPHRLVERDARQAARVDFGDEVGVVLQVAAAVFGAVSAIAAIVVPRYWTIFFAAAALLVLVSFASLFVHRTRTNG